LPPDGADLSAVFAKRRIALKWLAYCQQARADVTDREASEGKRAADLRASTARDAVSDPDVGWQAVQIRGAV
jgi:hypothetical protein